MFSYKSIIAAFLVIAVNANPIESGQAITADEVDFRVFNGTKTTIENHPSQVSIHYNHSFHCGGSIISTYYVLTAAHCLTVVNSSIVINATDLAIHIGSTHYYEGGKFHRVEEVMVHENYSYFTLINDIGLIRVTEPIKFNDTTVDPISLANQTPLNGTDAVVIGWGRTENGNLSSTLRELNVTIVDWKTCQTAWQKYPEKIHPSQICIRGKPKGKAGHGHGDSGGPLLSSGSQVGIVSFSYKVPLIYPQVYTNVAFYRDWIEKNVNDSSFSDIYGD